ncbi:unnamed protein product [Trifolium pratense]|uniref:Uncharacterized protein n=1 Tax=Trifolium pratense TaxID=57577 RepID=A0ACB0K633_TRIPR|nr:unnamed protein product [Trifolium pratense]
MRRGGSTSRTEEKKEESRPGGAGHHATELENGNSATSRRSIISLHDDIFIKILNLETAKEAWDKLKEEFQGSERTKKMQVLNLRREFEALKMKETETVREFSDRISKVVSQIRLLGEDLSDQRVVEKILVCLPERFEAKISSLEETKNFSQITLAELVNALQATEQRRSLRLEENVEGAFVANTKGKNQSYNSFGKKPFGEKKGKGKKEDVNNKGESWKKKFPICQHCKKYTHLEKHCWYRQDVKCRACNQLGHVEKVCKNKANQQRQQAQVVEHHQQEEQLFMASCYSSGSSKETWLIDSGCTNHMTHNVGIFKELDKSFFSKVTIGNGEHVDVKGKCVVAVETPSGYRIYNLETKKILVSRDGKFDEFSKWNWEKSQAEGSNKVLPAEDSFEDENSNYDSDDDFPIRGTRTLDDIYARCNIATLEPTRYAEAANVEGWKVAMQEEMKMIEKNQTWQLVDKPENQKIIGVKWVYRTKLNPDGSINKLKARLVVKGYFQQHGVDFSDTFAPVAKHDTIRLLVALAAKLGWKIYHFDVKSAFLNGLLDEDIYVDQPKGNESNSLSQFKQAMENEFEMTDLGEMKYFLGMEIFQSSVGIFISQKKYALEVLKKFHMDKCKPVSTPLVVNEKLSKDDGDNGADASIYRSIIGSLLYLSATRPDIMFVASLLSRFMHSPSQVHLGATKRVLSDWAGSVDDAKSTSGYVFSFGSAVFSWNSKKQEVVAQSSAEAEYISAAAATNQTIWLRKILSDVGQFQSKATVIWVDNKSAIAIAKNPVQHGRTKHIKVKYHAIREAEKSKEIGLEHCISENQIADIMTKALSKGKFEELRSMFGVFKKNIKEEC